MKRCLRLKVTLTAIFIFASTGGLACAKPIPHNDDLIYPVQSGETLSRLGKNLKERGALAVVQTLNRISDPDRILAGGTLRIPRELLRNEGIYAHVETFAGPVVITVANQAVTTKVGLTIGENASIQTGRNAFVTLRLSDGSAVSVPSQSDIRIARMRRILLTGAVERDVVIQSGRIHAQVTPMHDPESTFRVITPITMSAVRGTDFSIAYDPQMERSGTMVLGGKVAVSGSKAASEMTLTPGLGASSNSHGSTGPVELLSEPRMVDPGRVQMEDRLQFSIVPEAEAASYHLQIARDAGCLDVISEDISTNPSFSILSIVGGTYFVRMSKIDKNGLEGNPATYAFERRQNGISATMTQAKAGKSTSYTFKWISAADEPAQFRFRLTRKSASSIPIIDRIGLTDNSVEISGLPPGDYVWQVFSTLFGNKIISNPTPEQSFHITAKK